MRASNASDVGAERLILHVELANRPQRSAAHIRAAFDRTQQWRPRQREVIIVEALAGETDRSLVACPPYRRHPGRATSTSTSSAVNLTNWQCVYLLLFDGIGDRRIHAIQLEFGSCDADLLFAFHKTQRDVQRPRLCDR